MYLHQKLGLKVLCCTILQGHMVGLLAGFASQNHKCHITVLLILMEKELLLRRMIVGVGMLVNLALMVGLIVTGFYLACLLAVTQMPESLLMMK